MENTTTLGCLVLLCIFITFPRTKGACRFRRFGIDCRYSCNCPGGCNDVNGVCRGPCYPGWHSGNGTVCQTKNIAYNGSTKQSSNYYTFKYLSNKAVDGNRDQNIYDGSCSHTGLNKTSASWQVNIEPPTQIYQVKMYYRQDLRKRFRRFTLYLNDVDEEWRVCYHHQKDSIQSIVNVNCNITTKTKALFVYNERGTPETSGQSYERHAYMELCEVEVYVCSKGTYGDCRQFCYCKDGPCDFITGQCPGSGLCENGFTGQHCQTDCSSIGKYGVNCSESCSASHCFNRQMCHRVTGRCLDGCQDGWIEPTCVKHTQVVPCHLSVKVNSDATELCIRSL
ncbi:uncharacterized protein LOC121374593 [Gigantopelta aegis]|uniref:uncharacterized protein LOC121374593 n=1 Tax=Gigantopelta aegis TaxID=1735272 RepID=UPI001B88872E|nr:uncharacterized protein LOC121374593 [Gigantopelta aegis]